MQHLQPQKHGDSTLQMQLLCIVPSCEYHIDVVTFEMGLLQSGYFQYMSATGMDSVIVLFTVFYSLLDLHIFSIK